MRAAAGSLPNQSQFERKSGSLAMGRRAKYADKLLHIAWLGDMFVVASRRVLLSRCRYRSHHGAEKAT
jgi:hypothetical protein